MLNKRLKIVKFKILFLFISITFYSLSSTIMAHAQAQFDLSSLIQDIIVNNPEIEASWHQYQQLSNDNNGAQSISLMQMLNQGFTNPNNNETSLENTQLLAIRMHAERDLFEVKR